MKRFSVAAIAVGILFGASVQAQQKPSPADDKASQERLIRQAAERAAAEAEATARVQQKLAEEARKRDIERVREEEAKANVFIPLDLEVVISRYQGDKKSSSLPFALVVNAGSPSSAPLGSAPPHNPPFTQVRVGGQVPLPTTAPALGADGKPLVGFSGGGPVQYKDVGTSIDARARALGDGRFEVSISVEEDAIVTPQGASAGTLPVIRSFRTSNTLVLRDGQTRQFTAAADRITGEVVRVDVTLKVAK